MHRSIQVCVNTIPRRKVSNNLREAIAAARQYGEGYKAISEQFEVYNKED